MPLGQMAVPAEEALKDKALTRTALRHSKAFNKTALKDSHPNSHSRTVTQNGAFKDSHPKALNRHSKDKALKKGTQGQSPSQRHSRTTQGQSPSQPALKKGTQGQPPSQPALNGTQGQSPSQPALKDSHLPNRHSSALKDRTQGQSPKPAFKDSHPKALNRHSKDKALKDSHLQLFSYKVTRAFTDILFRDLVLNDFV